MAVIKLIQSINTIINHYPHFKRSHLSDSGIERIKERINIEFIAFFENEYKENKKNAQLRYKSILFALHPDTIARPISNGKDEKVALEALREIAKKLEEVTQDPAALFKILVPSYKKAESNIKNNLSVRDSASFQTPSSHRGNNHAFRENSRTRHFFYQGRRGTTDFRDFFEQSTAPRDTGDSFSHFYQSATDLPPNQAMIKIQLLIAKEECDQIFRKNINKQFIIKPRNIMVNSASTYPALSAKHYYQYQVRLSLWHAIFAHPETLPFSGGNRIHITEYANTEYQRQQYELLHELFDPKNSQLRNKLGLSRTTFYEINQKTTNQNAPWDFLRHELEWIYRHGPHQAISPPWAEKESDGTHHSEIYPQAYAGSRLDQMAAQISRHPISIGIKRYSNIMRGIIYGLPITIFLASFFAVLLETSGLLGIIASSIIIASLLLLPFSTVAYGFFQSFLEEIASFNQPLTTPKFDKKLPFGLKAIYLEALHPLLQILIRPIDPYYQGLTRATLQLLFPLRLAAGLTLSTSTIISMAFESVIFNAFKLAALAYQAPFNLYFDYPQILSAIKDRFKQTTQWLNHSLSLGWKKLCSFTLFKQPESSQSSVPENDETIQENAHKTTDHPATEKTNPDMFFQGPQYQSRNTTQSEGFEAISTTRNTPIKRAHQ